MLLYPEAARFNENGIMASRGDDNAYVCERSAAELIDAVTFGSLSPRLSWMLWADDDASMPRSILVHRSEPTSNRMAGVRITFDLDAFAGQVRDCVGMLACQRQLALDYSCVEVPIFCLPKLTKFRTIVRIELFASFNCPSFPKLRESVHGHHGFD